MQIQLFQPVFHTFRKQNLKIWMRHPKISQILFRLHSPPLCHPPSWPVVIDSMRSKISCPLHSWRRPAASRTKHCIRRSSPFLGSDNISCRELMQPWNNVWQSYTSQHLLELSFRTGKTKGWNMKWLSWKRSIFLSPSDGSPIDCRPRQCSPSFAEWNPESTVQHGNA